ncbi:YHS domain-containing (seleno)protein [Erythrobacter donghaensis]|jgi:YHS domain-containing protein|uniref:YHS domain-containing (seleno)protein n=1 Tax=Erythrobacter donghaensis TaxID=267135 RepID=UPI00093AE60B|nr:YHS domain-containing (seleno)protein [Erythrobacter donghaensis]
MKTARLLLALAALAAPLGLAVPAPALADGGIYASAGKIAVGGYDTVSYFRGQGKPVKGNAQFKVSWKGAEWRFASAANAAAFKANPAAYAPQYGGHCSWAIAQGYLAPGDPTAYDIVGGKLYLNYDQGIRAKWRKDISGFIAKGGPNWAKIPAGKVYGGSSWFGL